jgi:hypothetical protein
MPRDLNLDGAVDAGDHAGDARSCPCASAFNGWRRDRAPSSCRRRSQVDHARRSNVAAGLHADRDRDRDGDPRHGLRQHLRDAAHDEPVLTVASASTRLDTQATETLDKIADLLRASKLSTVTPQQVSPFSSSQIDFQRSTGFAAGATVRATRSGSR